MSTVLSRCSELREGLDRLKVAKDSEERARDLEQRRIELEERRATLAVVAAQAEVLLEHGHLSPDQVPDCTKALESCEKVEALLEPDPLGITKGRDYSYLLKRVSKVAERLGATTQKSWAAVVEQHQGVDEAFLKKVETFPGQAETVARVRELRDAYAEATAAVPASEDSYKRFEACYAALQQELSKLDPDAFPDDVLRFFRKAQSAQGAPLDLFTDSVRQWLAEHELLDGVQVRFTGGN